jgi:hypothetical protein
MVNVSAPLVQTWSLRRGVLFVFALFILTSVASACGESGPPGATTRVAGEAWWVLETEGFEIADASVYADGRGPAGHHWTLEYTSGMKTLQIVAFDRNSGMRDIVQDSPVTGEATVEGFKLTFRRSKGIPEDEIPPRFGADWIDDGLLIQFGGTAEESELRTLLKDLRRVDRERFDAEVTKAARRKEGLPSTPSPSLLPRPNPSPTRPNPTNPTSPRASTTTAVP